MMEKMMIRTCKALFDDVFVSFGLPWFLLFDLLFAILFLTIMLIKSDCHCLLKFLDRNGLPDIRICTQFKGSVNN